MTSQRTSFLRFKHVKMIKNVQILENCWKMSSTKSIKISEKTVIAGLSLPYCGDVFDLWTFQTRHVSWSCRLSGTDLDQWMVKCFKKWYVQDGQVPHFGCFPFPLTNIPPNSIFLRKWSWDSTLAVALNSCSKCESWWPQWVPWRPV